MFKPTLIVFIYHLLWKKEFCNSQYYNFLIQRENRNRAYSFIKPDEQRKLLQFAGFSNISENRFVYTEQAVLNFARKK